MQKLLSSSPAVSGVFSEISGKNLPEWFCTHDPEGQRLGSGGGTAHLIREAWAASDKTVAFTDWCKADKRIIIHAGGQSRRLPAYAAEGKSLLPVPVFRWSKGQQINQTLLDLQVPFLELVMDRAGESAKWCIASGDVLVMSEKLPSNLPDVDVLCVGLWDDAEVATKHGVFFTPRSNPEDLAFMLQKPTIEEIRQLAQSYFFLLDVGIWILSDRAMRIVLERSAALTHSGFNEAGQLKSYDLYGTFGPALGKNPHDYDEEISSLSSAILPLEDGEFYHFGSNRDLIRSTLRLQNRVIDQRRLSSPNIKPHPSLFVQNSRYETELSRGQTDLWMENSHVPASWRLNRGHVLTGIPENSWAMEIPNGLCLDILPHRNGSWIVRPYGMDDAFRGGIGAETTHWQGNSATEWFTSRGLKLADLGIDPELDIQSAPIFPLVQDLNGTFIQWMLAGCAEGEFAETARALYLNSPRISADEIGRQADLSKRHEQRKSRLEDSLVALAKNASRSVFYQVDLEHLAGLYAASGAPLPDNRPDEQTDLFRYVHDAMFRSRVSFLRNENFDTFEEDAFRALRRSIIESAQSQPVIPAYDCLEDQIIWGRSPVRLDLAGGWTDTPPYCFMNGGKVVNVAVELNGQPPIQAFVRMRNDPLIVLKSIDLGVTQELRTFEDISNYNQVGSGFAIPKAALALAGFLPAFRPEHGPETLEELLNQLGGGFELSLLCAVPKGSGLGTSSILSSTLLGVLNSLCQLGWDQYTIGQRALVLEQMLTSGGGWQDQFGGIIRGIKYLDTKPGLEQTPKVRWLPDFLMTDPQYSGNILLYYTGITRVAKSVLAEIVRGMFLSSQQRMRILERIGNNADRMRDVLQEGNWSRFGAVIERSWQLNQALDKGTNTPEIEQLLSRVNPWLVGKKLLGAGGGGYLLMVARDAECAARVKRELSDNPPNPRARFVNISVSQTGLQITRS